MLRIHIENHQDAVQLANVPRHPVGRIMLRFVAFLLALLLLEALLSCRGPDFTGTALEKDRLTSSRTFSIDGQPDPALYIWNMRPIPFDELKSLVSDRLMEKGYQQAPHQEADVRIVLTTFTEEPTPRSRITIMEMFDRPTSRKLWSGRAEIPYQIDPIQGVANEPTLAGLLDLVPPHIGVDHTSSDSMSKH
ncbi:MAG: hypothetical protein HXX12_16230 [Geothrix sp.]|uniref:DUF4136 domain-containing protein n=1 Tax=Geothrix sp. TaxID=1962974 RepID=UPI00181016AB|nr:DUF4136 domain-containing protein [Geothrix sp.]NWJ42510.1 hypothetical protein [Geothrix sp.]WIL19528.1 MAG: DUF4136 domain-containing protein [Geothrix sp.]